MYGRRFGRFSPVKEGDELDVKIEAIGEKGDGIAKKDGFVLIVPGTKKDDEVRIRVTKVLRRVGFGEVVGKAGKEGKKSKESEEEPEEQEEEMESDYSEDMEEEKEEEEEPEDYEDSEDFGEDLEE
ncbi:TRAM domain-containing protein [Candidatus Woesearchaeota archaeon]|nr:TRAM domain-containing protein [Candidatus Woesearchaeota archaeon]